MNRITMQMKEKKRKENFDDIHENFFLGHKESKSILEINKKECKTNKNFYSIGLI